MKQLQCKHETEQTESHHSMQQIKGDNILKILKEKVFFPSFLKMDGYDKNLGHLHRIYMVYIA